MTLRVNVTFVPAVDEAYREVRGKGRREVVRNKMKERETQGRKMQKARK
jgi:hypothetical protein